MAAVPSDLHATIETRLRAVGQRYTPKRRALVDMLRRAGKPVSMTDVVSGRSHPRRAPPIGTSRSLSMRAWCGA